MEKACSLPALGQKGNVSLGLFHLQTMVEISLGE